MVVKYHYWDKNDSINSFDIQPSKLKPLFFPCVISTYASTQDQPNPTLNPDAITDIEKPLKSLTWCLSRFLSFLSILLFERYSKNESAHLSKKVYRLLIIKTTHYSFIASEDGHLNSFHLEIPWGHLVPGLVLLFFTRVNIIHIADYPLKCLEITLKVLTQVCTLKNLRGVSGWTSNIL